ncbi:hypothetical protein KI387_003383, partial [Taxus chinensis]
YVIGVVVVIDVDTVNIEGLSIGDWDEISCVAIGKHIGTRNENELVDVSGIVDVVDADVFGRERDVSEVMMDVFGVDMGIVKFSVVVVKVEIDVDVENLVEVDGICVMIVDMIDIDVGAGINGAIGTMYAIGEEDEVDEISKDE